MGKQKHEKPSADLDRKDQAGEAGTENMAPAGAAGAVPEKPADAVSAAAPAGGDQPAAQPAEANTGAAVPGAAVAAGSQEAEKEVGDGKAAQTPADGEQAGAAPGQRDPHQAGELADGSDAANGAASLERDVAGADVRHGAGDSLYGGSGSAAGEAENGQEAPADDFLDDDFELDTAFTVAQLARACAAAGTIFANGGHAMTRGQEFRMREAEIMAGFVAFNPEAPLLAMYKHLEITLRLPETIPNNADMLALSMFRHACLAALEYERVEAAERAAAEFAKTPAASWGGATALDPVQPTMQPTGFTPL